MCLQQAWATVDECIALAKQDSYQYLRHRLMSTVRLQKKTGFFNEALVELDEVEQQLCLLLDKQVDPDLVKLLARVFRERMSVLATIGRYAEAK
jgi:hypothetical protein